MTTIDIPAPRLARELTLNVRVTRVGAMRFRLWLGCQIIKIAARVIGCKINVE